MGTRESEWIGKRIGPWQSDGVIGEGGRALVFRAERVEGGYQQTVAIKLSKPGIPGEEIDRERARLELLQENPQFPRLFGGGILPRGGPGFIVMEFVRGRPIDRYADEQGKDISARITLFIKVCEALTWMHQRSVFHLDLKPANILVTADENIKLIDFGVAEDAEEPYRPHCPNELDLETIEHASPERFTPGTPLSAAADVFSAASVLYLVATGRTPLQLANCRPAERLHLIQAQVPPSASKAAFGASSADFRISRFRRAVPELLRDELSRGLDHVLRRCLEKQPQLRYDTAQEFLRDLRRAAAGEVLRDSGLRFWATELLRTRPLWVLAAVIVVLSMLGALTNRAMAYQFAARGAEQQRLFLPILTEAAGAWKSILRPAVAADPKLLLQLQKVDAAITKAEALRSKS